MIVLKRLRVENFRQLRGVHLRFPEVGSVLIQGRNEAGKSTLFEAIYFALYGEPLIAPRGRGYGDADRDPMAPASAETSPRGRGYDTAIRYGANMAYLELGLRVRDTHLKVIRELRRGRPNRAQLTIQRSDGSEEEITRIASVNQRIVQELGGIDKDTLLNSCFVEQKKLSKLEGMGLQQREASISKLLNLDRFIEMEEEFRISSRDREELERLRARLELAETVAKLAELVDRRREVARNLALMGLRECLEEIERQELAFRGRKARLSRLAQAREAIADRLARIERAKEGVRLSGGILAGLERVADAEGELERDRQRLGELKRVESEVLPRKERGLAELEGMLLALGEVEEQRARTWELAEAVRRAKTALERHQQLTGARQAQERLAGLERSIVQAKEEQRAALSSEGKARASYRAAGRKVLLGALALVIGVILVLGGGSAARIVGSVVLLLGFGWGAWFSRLAWRARGEASAYAAQVEALSRRREEGRQRYEFAAETIGEARGRAEVEEELARLDQVPPASPGEAGERIAGLRGELGEVRFSGLEEQAERASAALHRLEGEEGRLGAEIEALEVELGGESPQELQRGLDEIQAEDEGLRRAIARREKELGPLLAARGLDLDIRRVQGAKSSLEAEVRLQREELGGIPGLQEAIAQREEGVRSLRGRLEEERGKLVLISGELVEWQAPGAVKRASVREGLFGLERLLEQMDETAARGEQERLNRQMGEIEAGIRASQDGIEGQRRQVLVHLSSLGHDLDDALPSTRQEVEDLEPGVVTVDPRGREDWEKEGAEVQRRLHILQYRRRELEDAWHLEGEELEVGSCRSEYSALEREHAVRSRASELVEGARQRIIARVLPNTERYMQQILPLLTAGRYYMAHITRDYRIRVWDGWARDYVEKELFSGGAQDQFSLALRLAFALAALPEEMGTRPGFVFLDEPLSSFDAERAVALVEMVTSGEIAKRFDQVFVISHNANFDVNAFTYRLQVVEGRVERSELSIQEDVETGIVED